MHVVFHNISAAFFPICTVYIKSRQSQIFTTEAQRAQRKPFVCLGVQTNKSVLLQKNRLVEWP